MGRPDDDGSAQWQRILTEGHAPLVRARRVFRFVPSAPRCKMCNSPFGGVGGRIAGLAGFRPSRKNPALCSRCCDGLPPGGAEVDVAVLFADVRGSTALGRERSAAEFAEVLNRFYSVATETLVRHDAVIDKLIGDEVMAFFVPGVSGPAYRSRAAEAGLDLLRAVGYGTPEGPWLALGVAVNAGLAYVGNVGSTVVDFTALGDCVNVAARMQEHAAAGEVLVGAGVVPEAPTRSLRLRDVEQPVEVAVLVA